MFTIDEYDNYFENLQKGYTIQEVDPIDGQRMFEVVKIPEPSAEELKNLEISELKQKLADTDYVVIKIAEGVATAEQYADIIAQRQQWRVRINELEA